MNVLSMRALMGAYQPASRPWLARLKQELERNVIYACDFIETRFPGIRVYRPQGTFVLLLDCEDWCKNHKRTIDEILENGVGVGVIWREGAVFHVPCGIRMNLALPHEKLVEVFSRLHQYVFR